jgi:hypothetical protein
MSNDRSPHVAVCLMGGESFDWQLAVSVVIGRDEAQVRFTLCAYHARALAWTMLASSRKATEVSA